MAAVRDQASAFAFERKAFYTPAEVGSILRVSTQTVLNWIRDGRLRGIQLSERIYRIPLGALLQALGEPARVTRDVRPKRIPSASADMRALAKEHRRSGPRS